MNTENALSSLKGSEIARQRDKLPKLLGNITIHSTLQNICVSTQKMRIFEI